jgi:hypothetical protein
MFRRFLAFAAIWLGAAAPGFPADFSVNPIIRMPNLFGDRDRLVGEYGADVRVTELSIGSVRIVSTMLLYSVSALGLSLPVAASGADDIAVINKAGIFYQLGFNAVISPFSGVYALGGLYAVLGSELENDIAEAYGGVYWYPADSESFPANGLQLLGKWRIGLSGGTVYGIGETRASYFFTSYANDLVFCATLYAASDLGSPVPLRRSLLLRVAPDAAVFNPMEEPPAPLTIIDSIATAAISMKFPLCTVWSDVDMTTRGPGGMILLEKTEWTAYLGITAFANAAWNPSLFMGYGFGPSLYLVRKPFDGQKEFSAGVSVFTDVRSFAFVAFAATNPLDMSPWY